MTGLAVETAAQPRRVPAGAAVPRPRVAVVLPRGEAIRNFVHTGVLDMVASQADLVLVTVLPSQSYRDLFERRFGGLHELHRVDDPWIARIHRELLHTAHGRWLWSEAAKARWRTRDADAATPLARAKRAALKLAGSAFAHQPGLTLIEASERRVSRWCRSTAEYIALFRDQRPTLVFNGSHVHGENAVPAIHAARALGIPTATFLFSWDNLTSQGRIHPLYDHYLVWNRGIRDQLLRIYPSVRPEQVTVTGTPQFDFHFRREFRWTREELCRRIGADPSRPIVLYTTGMANHMPGEPVVVEGIARMLREMTDLGRPQLVVRVYPKDRTRRFDALRAALPDVLFPPIPWDAAHLTPGEEDSYLLPNMLRHAAVGVNVASTVSLELCMFDRPVINVAYNPEGVDVGLIDFAGYYRFDHYKPVVDSGAVALAPSESGMRDALRRALTHPEERAPARRALIDRMFGDTLDGRSSDRVVEALLRLAAA